MDTDWITVGAKVAEHEQEWSTVHIRFATVERLTTTQIVLDNGNRYHRDGLNAVGGGRGRLRPLNDPLVRNAVARKELSDLVQFVHEANRSAPATVDAVLSALDAIEEGVRRARAAIEGQA